MRQTLILVLILAANAPAQTPDAVPPTPPLAGHALVDPFPAQPEAGVLFTWFVSAKVEAARGMIAARHHRDAAEVSRVLARFDHARGHAVTELRRLRGDYGPPPPPAFLPPTQALVLPAPGSTPGLSGLPPPAAPEKKSPY